MSISLIIDEPVVLNYRQQEVWPVLVASQYNGDYNAPIKHQYMYDIYVNRLLYGLSIDIKHIKITWTDTIQAIFLYIFFNKDFSFNISLKSVKCSVHVDKGHLEGSVSQICYLGPSFYFM